MPVQTLLLVLGAASCVWAGAPPPIPLYLDPSSCPPSYKEHPLILVSMDGFRSDYLDRGLTPTINLLANRGVRAPYVKPSFPTITFPNHYTIATGLIPPAHGIISNKFYAPEFQAEFRVGKPEFFQKRFWGGEPIWKTAENQGKKAATFFWPGSEVEGNRATYWLFYNETIPFQNRVDQVLSWLDLPAASRPSFITLYMHEPDSAGHDFGPYSPQVSEKLMLVDSMVARLIKGLSARRLLSCVNILMISDHGMAEAGQQRAINLEQYIPNLVNRTRFWDGIFARMTPNDGSETTKREMLQALSCKRKEMRVYEKTTLPARWHMGTQSRVEDIVLDLDAGYSAGGDSTFRADAGDHGYDNYFKSMNSLFLAHGPAFLRNTEVEIFQNIEVYNLMCHLLGVTPAPNNGTWGALHHLLLRPPPLHQLTMEYPPPIAGVPEEDILKYYQSKNDCKGDKKDSEELIEVLEKAQEATPWLMERHLPWGVPKMGQINDGTSLLTVQPDYITGYSTQFKLPLWSSYTLRHGRKSKAIYPWRSDVRLKPQERLSCQAYYSLAQQKLFPYPLFPPQFAFRDDCGPLAHLISNAVPTSRDLIKRWGELENMVGQWRNRYGTINVLSGPVFDYDADTFADDPRTILRRGNIAVPTHMFMVVTRCLLWVRDLEECPTTHLDALAFIYPQQLYVSNCLSADRFAQEFSAKVQDVEKITGLQLYPHLSRQDQIRMEIRLHSNIWGRESWANRLWADVFGLNGK